MYQLLDRSEAIGQPRTLTCHGSPRTKKGVVRILVVDHCVATTRFLARILERQGYEVITARNGTEALVVASDYSLDAVVLDLRLKGLDGIYVGRLLRKANSQLLLIATTEWSGPDDLRKTNEAGFDYHLIKPLDLPLLHRLLLEKAVDDDE